MPIGANHNAWFEVDGVNLAVVVKMCGMWVLLAEPTAYSLLGRSPPACQATCIQYAEVPDPRAKIF